MKNTLTLFFLLWVTLTSKAQPCVNIISNVEFQQKLTLLGNKPTDEVRLTYARSFLDTKCFTSLQVKQMALTFRNDAFRLQFTKAAYNATADKKNYYDVLDAFKTFSAAMRLYHFMDRHDGSPDPDPAPAPESPFPALPYPLYDNYRGPTGCNLPLTNNDFDVLIISVINQPDDIQRMNAGRSFVQNNCLSMAQFMKLSSLIQLESNRLKFMKDQFLRIYDLENYTYASALLTSGPYQNDWNAFASASLTNPAPPHPLPCLVSPAEFAQAKKAIENESFNNTKITLAKQIIETKKCFSALQIKELVETISFESGKLDLAKFAYDYCIDPGNYYFLNDAFSFSSSKEELMNFIKNKK